MESRNDWAAEKTVRGFFWRPDESDKDACAGTLHLTSNGEIRLDVFGWEREIDPDALHRPSLIPKQASIFFGQPSHRRVLGVVEDLGVVSLDRCVPHGRGRSSQVRLSSASYRVETVIRGQHYPLDDDPALHKLGFCATGIDQMLRDLPAQEATLHDGCRMQFVPTSDTEIAHVVILPNGPTPLGHLSRHAVSLCDFLSLSRMREAAIYEMWGIECHAPTDQAEINIRQTIPHNKPSADRRFVHPEEMLFSTDDIKNEVARVVERWFLLRNDYKDAVDLYFGRMRAGDVPIDIPLLVLFRAADAWCRVDCNVPEDGRTPSAGKVIEHLIDAYTSDLALSFSKLTDVEAISKLRNKIMHPGRDVRLSDLDPLEYVATERQLTLLLRLCMLRKIGLSQEALKRIASKDVVRNMLETRFIEFV